MTTFFMYFYLCVGCFGALMPELVFSYVFASNTRVMCQTLGVTFVSLSLMTCPNPHGYFMASVVLALAGIKFAAVDQVVLGKSALASFGLLAAPLALSSYAVFGNNARDHQKK